MRTAWNGRIRPALAALVTISSWFTVAPARAQVGVAPPNSYALTNARIVSAPGRVIERGTVVIRDGRITAVGAQVSAPPDVQTIDLNGLTVYPGLIDAASHLGLPRAPTGQQGGRGQAPTPAPPTELAQARPAPGRTEVPELQPARLASQVVQLRDADLETMRAMGITIAGLAFDGGILSGQTAVLSLAGLSVDSTLLRSTSALQIGLQTRRGGYPTTLMGTMAYLEQAFSDALYQKRAAEAFERNPAQGPRPVRDADREALIAAAEGRMPVLIAASRENDLRRAVALAKRLNLDYLLLGAQEGFRATDLLAKEAKPVIVSLNFPRPSELTGRAFELHVAPVTGRDTVAATADSAAAGSLRANAAALVRAGVPVALASYGLQRPSDFRQRVRNAVEAGLSSDEALRALTITPARILGIDRIAGTIEPGKLGNLVVSSGDLFARDSRIRHVFIEGRRFDIRESDNSGPGRGRSGSNPGGNHDH